MSLLVEAVRGALSHIRIEPLSPGGIGLVVPQEGESAQSRKIRHNSEVPTGVGGSARISPFVWCRRCVRQWGASAYRQLVEPWKTGAEPAWQLSQSHGWPLPCLSHADGSLAGVGDFVHLMWPVLGRVGWNQSPDKYDLLGIGRRVGL